MSNKYTLDNILEMLNGIDNGFSYEQVYFVYHSLNGNKEQAEYFEKLCLDEANKLNREIEKLKKPEEIENNISINNIDTIDAK
jgi:hypothetical protein